MIKLIGRRLVQMVLIMAVASLLLFAIFDTDQFKKRLAVQELGGFAVSALTEESYKQWLANRGLDVPFYQRYTTWIGNIMTGDLGFSYEKNRDVLVGIKVRVGLHASGDQGTAPLNVALQVADQMSD